MHCSTALAAALACLMVGAPAQARVAFDGFGQVVAGSALGNAGTAPGSDYAADPGFASESLFALQTQVDLADDLDATAQIVADGASQDDFQPRFAWFYAGWQMNPHWLIRSGRQRLPLYRYSQYLQEGQAYPWIRPPSAVYSATFSDFDGVSASADYRYERWAFKPVLFYGGYQGPLDQRGNTLQLQATNLAGTVLELDYDSWLRLRAWYALSKNTVHTPDIDSLVANLQAEGQDATAAALAADGDQARYQGLGIEFDRGGWTLGGEYQRVTEDNSFMPLVSGYYLLACRRLGRFTPLLTYGHVESKPEHIGAATTLLPTDPFYGAVQQTLADAHAIDDYIEAGLRFELNRRTALKLDYTRYESGIAGVAGANLLSAGVTFSF